MIPSSHAIVTLKPARQAALQAIMFVEDAQLRGRVCPQCPMSGHFANFDQKQPHEHGSGAAHSRPELGPEASPEQPQTGGGGAR